MKYFKGTESTKGTSQLELDFWKLLLTIRVSPWGAVKKSDEHRCACLRGNDHLLPSCEIRFSQVTCLQVTSQIKRCELAWKRKSPKPRFSFRFVCWFIVLYGYSKNGRKKHRHRHDCTYIREMKYTKTQRGLPTGSPCKKKRNKTYPNKNPTQ